jgi:hypothetical protein
MRWRRAVTVQTANGQYHKIDITLDEEDLARMLAEKLPGTAASQLAVREVWQLLEQEAELLLTMEQKVRLDLPGNDPLIKQLLAAHRALWDRLSAKYVGATN